MEQLHPDTLDHLAGAARTPAYHRQAIAPGIVHLGPGAFHRAHQAVYTERAMEHDGGDWGIVGVSLRSASIARQLNPQQGLYSVWSEDGEGRALRVIGALQKVLVASEEMASVITALADPATRIVTLTITEKGYNLAADGESLDRDDPQIAADLADPEHPRSAIGVLALGLRARLDNGGAPLTILSCDNLSENSKVLHLLLRDYLEETFAGVLPWLACSVTFPCSMVDRIVPATTPEQKERQAMALGLRDDGAVSTEPFIQWIIEDNFAAGRPAWDQVGVQFVRNILPYENIKLRLLNASHSAIAYCGLLAGKDTVDAVMADPRLRAYVEALMAQDLMPVLDVPRGFDLGAYRDDLLARFSNPCLAHRCAQIAMDGSEKISQRWLPTLKASAAPHLRQALAAWCYFVLFTDLAINDPRSARLLELRQSDAPVPERLAQVLACARVDADSMRDFAGLYAEVERNVDRLSREGVYAILEV